MDLHDGHSFDDILDDTRINGLCFERCIWRCNIKRMINKYNKDDYLFLSENTAYGTAIQQSLTYHKKLFVYLNEWLYNLNKSIFHPFLDTEQYRIYIFEFKMYSDIFYQETCKKDPELYFFNTKNIKNYTPAQENACKNAIKKLTDDLYTFLSIFKHFSIKSESELLNKLRKRNLYI